MERANWAPRLGSSLETKNLKIRSPVAHEALRPPSRQPALPPPQPALRTAPHATPYTPACSAPHPQHGPTTRPPAAEHILSTSHHGGPRELRVPDCLTLHAGTPGGTTAHAQLLRTDARPSSPPAHPLRRLLPALHLQFPSAFAPRPLLHLCSPGAFVARRQHVSDQPYSASRKPHLRAHTAAGCRHPRAAAPELPYQPATKSSREVLMS